MKIKSFPLDIVRDRYVFSLPRDATILGINTDDILDEIPMLVVLYDERANHYDREFVIYKEGDSVITECMQYVGTFSVHMQGDSDDWLEFRYLFEKLQFVSV